MLPQSPTVTPLGVSRPRLLVPIEAMRAEVGLERPDESMDTDLIGHLRAVGRSIGQRINRDPWRRRYVERVSVAAAEDLFLSRWPITSVLSVSLGGTVIEPDAYSVCGNRNGIAALGGCWRAARYEVEYVAGWSVPGETLTEWVEGSSVSPGTLFQPTDPDALFILEAQGEGVMGAVEPVCPEVEGEVVQDGDVMWTAVVVQEVPEEVQALARVAALSRFRGDLEVIAQGVQSQTDVGGTTRYLGPDDASDLPSWADAVLGGYRCG